MVLAWKSLCAALVAVTALSATHGLAATVGLSAPHIAIYRDIMGRNHWTASDEVKNRPFTVVRSNGARTRDGTGGDRPDLDICYLPFEWRHPPVGDLFGVYTATGDQGLFTALAALPQRFAANDPSGVTMPRGTPPGFAGALRQIAHQPAGLPGLPPAAAPPTGGETGPFSSPEPEAPPQTSSFVGTETPVYPPATPMAPVPLPGAVGLLLMGLASFGAVGLARRT